MDDMELGELWRQYNQKIESVNVLHLQSLVLHLQTFEYLQTEKAKSKLRGLSSFKKWMIGLGILWVLFLVFLIVHSLAWPKLFFVLSVAAIAGFNIYAVIVYIRHTVLISAIDNSDSLVEVQEKTARLKASTLQTTRIMFLQTPFYSTFYWSLEWMRHDPAFWFIAFPVALILAFLSIWLYRNIHIGNADKRWFRFLFGSKEWTSVIKAMRYLQEIEEYKRQM